MLDLVIIGAGPSGISCGISASKAGLNFLILEKGVLVNSIFHFPTNMTFFSTSKLLEIGDIPFISHGDKPTRREALEYYRRIVQSYQMPIKFYEEAQSLQNGDEYHTLTTNKSTYRAKAIIVTTGFFDKPVKLNVPGEELKKVRHYYEEAHPYVGQNLLVIGAANSACDVALETWQKGANVTMAVRENQLYQRVKYWILPNIENRIKEGSIKAFFNTLVEEIREDEVVLNQQGKIFTIPNDFVLAMTGYQPDYALIEKLNIPVTHDELKKPIFDPKTLETPYKNIFVAGVLIAGMNTSKLFIENTRHHGDIIVSQILKNRSVTIEN